MMRKNLRQSIKKSMGRYIAIVAIIALGAGLFCGLRVTKKDMIATVQDYTDAQNMFDLRVMSTYGWTEDDVFALSQTPGIENAEGSVSLDALLHFQDSEDSAYKLLSIPETVNRIGLDAGRLPQSGDECLADGFYFDESVIGKQIIVSAENEESTLENLAYDSYTIVGLCNTPLYLNMQRGSTTIGSGALATYFYLPKDGFALDIYTEINLTLQGDFDVYSDEYNDAMDAMAELLEPIAQPLADQRFVDVMDEAEREYADGMAEYTSGLLEFYDGKAEAEAQLAEAEQKLLDGEAGIESNRKLLEDGLVQLEDGKKTLEESKSTITDSRTALAAAKTEAYAQLAAGYEELFANYKEVTAGLNQVEAGISQIDLGMIQIDSGITQLQSGIEQIDSGMSTVDLLLSILDPSIKSAQSALDDLKGLTDQADYLERLAQAQAKLDELTAQRDECAAQREELVSTRAECEAQLADLQKQKADLQAQRTELVTTQTTLKTALDTIQIGLMEADNAQVQAENQFAASESQLDAAEAQLEAGMLELEAKRLEIEDGLAQLEEAEAELASGRAEFETEKANAEQELLNAETELKDAKAQLEEARETIDDMEPAQVYALTRNTNVGYVVFESDSDIVAGVAEIFPVFFLAVAALVCITTMTRMVDEERTQIGILKALGYSNFSIMGKYLAYSGSGAILGCATGVFAGSIIFPQIIWYAYCIMYNFRDQLTLTFDYATCATIILAYTGLTLLVTWYCCRRSLKEVPAELIRPKAPAAGKQIILEKLPVWKKLKFLDKVAVRNIFRYRQRLAMMLLGIGGCTALLITGFGLSDSISGLTEEQFESVMTYDIGVTFADPLTEEEQEAFRREFRGQADQVLFCHQSGIDLEFDNSVKNINLLAVERPLDGIIDLHNGNEELTIPGQDQALISIGAATSMGIEVGDTVIVRNSDLEELKLTVSGIFDNNVYNYVIITGQTMRSQWGRSPEMSSAFVVKSPQQDVHELGANITKYNGVLSVAVNADTASTVNGMMDALDAVVALVVICAGLLAAIVLYNLTNINIKERVREIATIKVLGFNAAETGAYVFKENLTLTVMGTVLGLGGGKLLHAVVMSYVRIDMVWFANRINLTSYILAALLTLLCALIVDFIMYFQLDKINMAEALKSVE